jgi:hypothetical protein
LSATLRTQCAANQIQKGHRDGDPSEVALNFFWDSDHFGPTICCLTPLGLQLLSAPRDPVLRFGALLDYRLKPTSDFCFVLLRARCFGHCIPAFSCRINIPSQSDGTGAELGQSGKFSLKIAIFPDFPKNGRFLNKMGQQ